MTRKADRKVTKGFFEIGIYAPKTSYNVGTLWRSAFQLGANGIFTIGRRYRKESSDTVNAVAQMPMRHFEDFDQFFERMPLGARLIGVEMGGYELSRFDHPKQAVYLLGAEDYGLPDKIRDKCWAIVSLEAVNTLSYNVAVAGSLVMYNRLFH